MDLSKDMTIRRASWYPSNTVTFREEVPKCSVQVHPDYEKRRGEPPHRCPFDGRLWYGGKRYCRRHHPIAVAEREAHKWNAKFDTYPQHGFVVLTKKDHNLRNQWWFEAGYRAAERNEPRDIFKRGDPGHPDNETGM